MNFSLNLPCNNLSFGQTSLSLLYEFYKKNLQPNLFPIGEVQLNSYEWIDQDFQNWLGSCIKKANLNHKRFFPSLKLWHISGANETVSHKNLLMTFQETSKITDVEKAICQNNTKVIVTSKYSQKVFNDAGLDNVVYIPLAFDSKSFKVTNKKYFNDNRINFILNSKLEKRKKQLEILQLWVARYGNNPNFSLSVNIFNPFLKPEHQQVMIQQALQGKHYFNVNLLGPMEKNSMFNDFLNSADIGFGLSGGEGFDLCAFHTLALGKHLLALNEHVYKDYCNEDNSILIPSSGMSDVYDGMFFHPNQDFNQGQFYDWTPESFYNGCDQVIQRVLKNRTNEAGLKLQEEFTWEKTANLILKELQEIS